MLLYQPYTYWYGAGYNAVELWKGTRTPFWSYITHWGVFLFFIIAWMGGETIDWMAFTPLRSLTKIRPYLWLVQSLIGSDDPVNHLIDLPRSRDRLVCITAGSMGGCAYVPS